jgi:hypothetical protein
MITASVPLQGKMMWVVLLTKVEIINLFLFWLKTSQAGTNILCFKAELISIRVINVKANDTISDISEKLYAMEGIPPESHGFIFSGSRLNPLLTVGQCGMKESATLYLHLALFGGGPGRRTKVYAIVKSFGGYHLWD